MPNRPAVSQSFILAAAALASLAPGTPAQATSPLPPPTVLISSARIVEGNAGGVAFEASVSLSVYGGQSPGPYEVEIEGQIGSADLDDFEFAPIRLTVAQGTTQTVRGSVKGDTIFEGDETFTLRARGLGPSSYLGSQPGIVTIVDDDSAGAKRLTIDAATTVPEGNDGWHVVEVAARLSAPTMNVVSFDYETTGGQAAYQVGLDTYGDYRAITKTQKIAPGETLVKIPVEIFGDTTWELDSTFEVKLFNVRGALIEGAGVGRVTIANDDAPSTLRIDDVQVFEGNAGTTKTTMRVRLDPPAPANAKVWLTIAGGAARAGADFEGGGFQVLYPPPGATEMTFPIGVVGDTVPECDEGLSIQYQGVSLGDDRIYTAHLTILDDDGGPKGSLDCPDPFIPTPPSGMVGPDTDIPPGPTEGDPDTSGAVDTLPDRGGCAVAARAPGTPASLVLVVLVALLVVALGRRRVRRAR